MRCGRAIHRVRRHYSTQSAPTLPPPPNASLLTSPGALTLGAVALVLCGALYYRNTASAATSSAKSAFANEVTRLRDVSARYRVAERESARRRISELSSAAAKTAADDDARIRRIGADNAELCRRTFRRSADQERREAEAAILAAATAAELSAGAEADVIHRERRAEVCERIREREEAAAKERFARAASALTSSYDDRLTSALTSLTDAVHRRRDDVERHFGAAADTVTDDIKRVATVSRALRGYVAVSSSAYRIALALDKVFCAVETADGADFADEWNELCRAVDELTTMTSPVSDALTVTVMSTALAAVPTAIPSSGVVTHRTLRQTFPRAHRNAVRESFKAEKLTIPNPLSALYASFMSALTLSSAAIIPGDSIDARLTRANYHVQYGAAAEDIALAVDEMIRVADMNAHVMAAVDGWIDAGKRRVLVDQTLTTVRAAMALITTDFA